MALSAIGSKTRYTVVRLLAAATEELCVCEIEPVVEVCNWALGDPGEQPIERVREIRDEVEERVVVLFDEVEREAT